MAGGAGHEVHAAPHEFTLMLLAQLPLHAWLPAVQLNPQVVPLHVAVAPEGGTQGEHEAPHVRGSLLLTHMPPHR